MHTTCESLHVSVDRLQCNDVGLDTKLGLRFTFLQLARIAEAVDMLVRSQEVTPENSEELGKHFVAN